MSCNVSIAKKKKKKKKKKKERKVAGWTSWRAFLKLPKRYRARDVFVIHLFQRFL